jgi:GH15 family glucan-1,4-alpha-glucosidase
MLNGEDLEGAPKGTKESNEMTSPYPPIRDYGAIGDCRTMALVSRTGSIDWWCEPRFDAPALFSRILDWQKGGSLHLEAERLVAAGRRYLPASAVLETTLDMKGGTVIVTDFLAIIGKDDAQLGPAPYARQKLVRLIRCERGRVNFRVRCVPRPHYGLTRPRISLAGPPGARRRSLKLATAGDRRRILLGATLDWGPIRDAAGTIDVTLGVDEEIGLAVDYGPGDMVGEGVTREAGRAHRFEGHVCTLDELHQWRDETLAFWSDWTAVSTYDGPYRNLVRRSAITLKLLTYHPTGALIAAGTTSLPEDIGGERNWDYRFTWLRDASFTLYALHTLGYRGESDAFMDWLTHACREHADPLVLYRVDGSRPGHERHLDELEGYCGSRPVRIGNEAAWQRQLDIYGEVLDAAYLDGKAGNPVSDEEWELLAHFADLAADRWRRPDTSIWEVRGGRRDFTYSKVMCWVALDRIQRLAEMLGRTDQLADRLARWRHEAAAIRRAVLSKGRRSDGAFVQYFGSERIDASALLFPLVGFVKATAPSAEATLRAVCATLEVNGLVKRYEEDVAVEGITGKEAYFLICSYWLCDNVTLRGELDEARRRFEEISAHANDLGLFSEEWDPVNELALGNFPQAFTHIALISSAHNLERAAKGRLHGAVRSSAPADE